MTTAAISALIGTYNQAHFLEQALTSVLEQGLPPSELEIVVVDDGSTDNTASLVAKFAPRVRYLPKKNGGQISAYNFAVPETRAPIVAFLDADDWWAKDKLKTVLDAFEKDSAVTAVGHGFIEFHDQSRTEISCLPGSDYRLNLSSSKSARFAHSGRRFMGTSKLAVRRTVLEKLGTLPDDLIFFDGPVHLFALALGSAVILNQPLAFYRVHGQNLYESAHPDPSILRRKCQIIDAQRRFLPPRMAAAGVSEAAIAAVLEPQELDRERMRIDLEGGWPWQAFSLEVRRFRASYAGHSLSYGIFKWLALTPALFLPPKSFYRLRKWYSRSNLRDYRRMLGEPTPVAEIDVQKVDH